MTEEKRKEIFQKIEELRRLAQETNSPLLLFMKECDEAKGRHIAVYGSGIAIKNLIVDACRQDADLMKVMKAARNEAFPSPITPVNESAPYDGA